MGTAVPIAIGLGIAKPDTPMICILGEGGFSSSFNEISLISTLGLPICLLILSDNSMHSVVNNRTIDQSIKNKFFPANFQKLKTTTPPDVPCINASTPSKFVEAISNWDMKSPKLIFLDFDPSSYATGVEFLR
jgi:thiamine pyrophosphate-dependent acetolactate synthase large subunit-like protein